MIRFECENCSDLLVADVSMRGEYEVCPNCGAPVRVPFDAESSPAPDWRRDFS